MKHINYVTVNTAYVNKRIADLGLKRDWLAQEIGVNPKTVTRWTTGKVNQITRDNAVRLARCLHCRVEDLVDQPGLLSLGSYSQREEALTKLILEDLPLLVSPSGKWPLLESIVQASVSPNLTKSQMGRLYNWLSVAKWRQQDYELAQAFAATARELGTLSGDTAVYVKAVFNLGTVASITGNHAEALRLLSECYELREHISTPELASLCTNLSMVHRDYAEFAPSLKLQHEAVKLFESDDRQYNLAIAHNCLGFIYTEVGCFDHAVKHLDIALTYTQQANYEAGKVVIPLYYLDALTLKGDIPAAQKHTWAIDKYLGQPSQGDLFGFEFIGRYFRHAGDFDAAQKVLNVGLAKTHKNPTERASLYHELSRLFTALKRNDDASSYRAKGNELYMQMHVLKRVAEGPLLEYGQGRDEICTSY